MADAEKNAEQIYADEKCFDRGPFYCLCGACNLVTFLFTAMVRTEIFSVWPGGNDGKVMDRRECLAAERASASAKSWGLRLVGWLMLWVGLMMVLSPLQVLPDIIPFLGPYLGSGVGWMIGLLSFLITLAAAVLIVSLSYLTYRPAVGIIYLAMALLISGFIVKLGHHPDALASMLQIRDGAW